MAQSDRVGRPDPNRALLLRLRGAPTSLPIRLLLEPVGVDWDGNIRSIDELTRNPVDLVSFTIPAGYRGRIGRLAGGASDGRA